MDDRRGRRPTTWRRGKSLNQLVFIFYDLEARHRVFIIFIFFNVQCFPHQFR